eukprot:g34391.t1
MGEILNEHFASVFTVEKDIEDRELGEVNSDILKNVYITEEVMLDVLKHIKVDKSLGLDEVYPSTLREAREVIARPLAEIFISSIATGEVLEDRRLANMVPQFKKGEVMKRIDEGRAVHLIYMDFSKVFDKVPHGRLVNR